jgi:hypothetical protein
MTEELVTLETAKLLKEKGFNEFCEFAYADEDLHIMGLHSTNSFFNEIGCGYTAPTKSIAQKWLRETKNLHIEISYMYGNYWIYDILTIPNHDLVGLSDRPIVHYKSYEEALEAGLQEALKLI